MGGEVVGGDGVFFGGGGAMVADNLLILKALILQPILFSRQDIYSFR